MDKIGQRTFNLPACFYLPNGSSGPNKSGAQKNVNNLVDSIKSGSLKNKAGTDFGRKTEN